MKIYGITGTNGKTTTAIVLGQILREEFGKQKVGLLSTEVFWLGDEEKKNETHMTTINSRQVYGYLKRMKAAGVRQVVLEMTSHALDQNRLAGVTLAGAIILNITHEHLDYHKTMKEYRRAKFKIVDYLKAGAPLIITSPLSPLLRKERGTGVRLIEFTSEQAQEVSTPLPGDFNKENVLAASLLAKEIGIKEEVIKLGISKVRQIPGRMEWIEFGTVKGGEAQVVIDFALTPDALDKLYKYLRNECKGKLIAVFGAAGRRDRKKRPVVARTVAAYADEIVITQDEPYDEPEEQIYRELEEGLKNTKVSWRRIEDRREAMSYAIRQAKAGDVVVVTGMGNFNSRGVGDKQIPWNDIEVAKELIKETRE